MSAKLGPYMQMGKLAQQMATHFQNDKNLALATEQLVHRFSGLFAACLVVGQDLGFDEVVVVDRLIDGDDVGSPLAEFAHRGYEGLNVGRHDGRCRRCARESLNTF